MFRALAIIASIVGGKFIDHLQWGFSQWREIEIDIRDVSFYACKALTSPTQLAMNQPITTTISSI